MSVLLTKCSDQNEQNYKQYNVTSHCFDIKTIPRKAVENKQSFLSYPNKNPRTTFAKYIFVTKQMVNR